MSRGRQDGTLIARTIVFIPLGTTHHQPIDRLILAAPLTGNILAANGSTSIEVNQLGKFIYYEPLESRL